MGKGKCEPQCRFLAFSVVILPLGMLVDLVWVKTLTVRPYLLVNEFDSIIQITE